MTTRILVAGASGALGHHVLDILKSRGYWVRALTRQDPARSKLEDVADEVVQGDAFEGRGLAEAVDGVELVLSSVGASLQPTLGAGWRRFGVVDVRANRNLIAAAKAQGVKKMGYASVSGAERFPHLDYMRAHHIVAQELAGSGLDHTVIRPNGFFSGFAEFLEMGRAGKVPLFGAGAARNNPVHDRDVAEACITGLEGDAPVIDVGGPDVLTRREIVDLVFTSLEREPQIQKIPLGLVHFGSLCLRPFHPRISHLFGFMAGVTGQDVVAPATGSRRLSDYYAELAGATSP